MSRARTKRDLNEEAMAEAELKQLKRQHRVLLNNHKAYREESKGVVRKQKELRAELEREYEELMKSVCKLDVHKNQLQDAEYVGTLHNLGSASSEYSRLIKEEKDTLHILDASIVALEKKISSVRNSGYSHSIENIAATDKRRTVLENRLDLATTKLNSNLTENHKLHKEIDSLQIQRKVFLKLSKKLEKKVKDCKEEKAKIIQETTAAYESRDEAQNKIKALRERHDKDKHSHDSEIKELQRVIAHDNRIKEFLLNNTSDRAALKAEELDKKIQRKDPNEEVNADKLALRSYQDVFKDIQAISGQDDVDDIVEHFLSVERENFALFNLVTEKNSECMQLDEELKSLKAQIEEFSKQGSYVTDNYTKMKLSLQSQIEQTRRDKNTLLRRSHEQTEMLERLFVGIMKLFSSLQCDDKTVAEMLGPIKINPKNVMAYIGLVEKKATELLTYQAFVKHKESLLQGLPAVSGKSSPAQRKKTSLLVCPPSVDDESFAEDSTPIELKPMTRSEISNKLFSNFHQHMAAHQRIESSGNSSVSSKRK